MSNEEISTAESAHGGAALSRVLVIDDEPAIQRFVSRALGSRGYAVTVATDGAKGLETFSAGQFDAVLVDRVLPDMDGLELIRRLKGVRPNTVVLVMTAYSSVGSSIDALRAGADEYVVKPFNINHIDIAIRRNMRLNQRSMAATSSRQVARPASLRHIVGTSKAMCDLLDMVQRVAAFDSTVLITGESGSGKELVASALHYNTLNPRKDQAFLAVNCGALPETLLESELFGYLKGAFTGATANKKGFFEVTHEGTLFLDEIGEVPLATQAKLLRVLDMGEFIKLGSTEPTHVDVRIVAATNKDLSEEVAQRVFRADLYHRLNVVEIHVPSLREHREDIAELVTYFLETYNRECGKTVKVDDQAVAALSAYDWPGNIRELKNFVHRLVLVSNLDVVHAGDLPAAFQMSDRATPLDGPLPFGERKRMVVEQFERQYFHQLLEQAGGNVSRAARTARMGRRYLIDRLKLYGLEPREFRRK